jgi:hypothetical protein
MALKRDADPAAVKKQFRKPMSLEPTTTVLQWTLLETPGDKEAACAALCKAFGDPAYRDTLNDLFLAVHVDRFGDRDLALTWLHRLLSDADVIMQQWLWHRFATDLRTDPHIEALLGDVGLADYIRECGNWGDYCKPLGKDDLECH